MKVIIAGSRHFDPYDLQWYLKNSPVYDAWLMNADEIVSGCAIGGDEAGEIFAEEYAIHIKSFPVYWRVDGKFDRSAGIKRNRLMGDYGDCLIALWDGKSRGTKHMIEYMVSLGKPMYVEVIKNKTS